MTLPWHLAHIPHISVYWCLLLGFALYICVQSQRSSFFWVALLDHFSSLFIWNAATMRQSPCTWLSPPWVQELLVILTSLDLFDIHITDRNMCCDCNVSEDTYGSFSILRFFFRIPNKNLAAGAPKLTAPARHCGRIPGCASTVGLLMITQQCWNAYWIALPSSLPLCESANEDLMGYGISWNTMRCRYYEM